MFLECCYSLKNVDAMAQNSQAHTPVTNAVLQRDIDRLGILLGLDREVNGNNGCTALHWAAIEGIET